MTPRCTNCLHGIESYDARRPYVCACSRSRDHFGVRLTAREAANTSCPLHTPKEKP